MGISKTNLFNNSQNAIADLAKALAHPARIAIIQHLLRSSSCINSDLVAELGLAQATISQHLRELKQRGIITGTIDGSRLNYCIDRQRWQQVRRAFLELFIELPENETMTCTR
jgi:DNA-binding transcriptional ArsR family regulator